MPQTGAEPVAQLEIAQLNQLPGSISSIPRIQKNALKNDTQLFDDRLETDNEEDFFQQKEFLEMPIWPEEIDRQTPLAQGKKAPRTGAKKTASDSGLKGLKKRSLNKARQLDMPPTPIGHDWHVTDGGWNLVRSWSEKEGLAGQKIKKERYSGYLSRDAWQVMKEYEYEKIIAQIGQQFGRHGGR